MSNDLSADLASLKIDRDRDPERKSPLRYVVIVGAVVAVVAAVYFLAVPYIKAEVFKAEVAVTEISLVSPAQASVELTSTGYVKPQKISNVAPKVAGKVKATTVKQGDTVKIGDVLYELEVDDQKAAIRAAQAAVAAARARTATAKAQLAEVEQQAARATGLAAKGVTAKSAADDLNAKVKALAEQVRANNAETTASSAQVRSLRVNLGGYTVLAPINGTVLSRVPEVGEAVAPSAAGIPGGGTIEIADFTTLAVETDVPEDRLRLAQIGGPCEIILDAFPGKRYRGKVTEIVPRVNRAKATVTVKVVFVDDAAGVLPDMAARVAFLGKELDQEAIKEPPKLVVPEAAVAERSGAKVVFVIDDGRVRMRNVVIGERHASGWQLIEGPPAGTRVVKNPAAALRDGEQVKERTDG